MTNEFHGDTRTAGARASTHARTAANGQQVRLAVDIGGTFTDVVVEWPGGRCIGKVLTTPDAPENGFIEGARLVLEKAGMVPDAVGLIVHGTTLATNALIERRGARVALVCTDGFRDSLEMAYEHRFEQADAFMVRPEPLVPRPLRFEVPERVAADGTVLKPLDEAAVHALVPRLKAARVEAIAIGFLHSYAYDAHERRTAEILARELPGVSVCLSSAVSPEIREYDRISTTVANAYVRPLMDGYLGRLESLLARSGFAAPLLLMMSSGGMTTVATARRFPIRLVESGPAGGAVLARTVAMECERTEVLSFDMGGTTAKVCFLDDYQPHLSRSFEVARECRFLKGSGLPIRIPVIEMVEIGAGGGSLAKISELGTVEIGPESAGSQPGPACYARGGSAPTVTDADVVLGRIDPVAFAAGRVPLRPDLAEHAVGARIGASLGGNAAIGATAISEIVDENMSNAARVHAVELGKDLERCTLIAFGGAAPLHAARVAEKIGCNEVIVPIAAGVGSAVGFLRAGIGYEVVRTRTVRLRQFDFVAINAMFAAMRSEAAAVVEMGAGEAPLRERRTAFMRYQGQGHEIAVPLSNAELTAADAVTLQRAFEAEYKRHYGRIIPDQPAEVVTWSLALGTAETPSVPVPAAPRDYAAPKPFGVRRVRDVVSGEDVELSTYRRGDLVPGQRFSGPALVVEDETTTYVTGGFDVQIHPRGHLVMTRRLAS